MLFMAGLELLDRPSREVLLSYMNCVRGASAARLFAGQAIKRLGRAGRWGGSWPRRVGEGDLVKRELRRLSGFSDRQISDLLWQRLSGMAGFRITKNPPAAIDKKTLAGPILRRAARSVKLDPSRYASDAALESAVVEESIGKIVEEVQQQLDEMSPGRSEELGRRVRAEVDRLAQADKDALREFLDLDRVADRAFASVAKAALPTIAAQAVAGTLGFGPYLFLSLMVKALGSLVGITFAFGTYVVAASALALCLSPAFAVAVIGLAGGMAYRAACRGAQERVAQLVVLFGHAGHPTLS